MIDGLINGKIYGTPAKRLSKTGNTFATCKIRIPTGSEGGGVFGNVICFDTGAVNTMLALHEGDAVSLCGTVTVSAYSDKAGEPKPSLDITAQQILTAYHIRHKRQQVQNQSNGADY